jgi:DNA polymerase III alpha subunit
MNKTAHGEIVLDQQDLQNLLMQGHDITQIKNIVVAAEVDLQQIIHAVENSEQLITWTFPAESTVSIPEFDRQRQKHWFMPDEYRNMDIAAYVLSLCCTPEQLQRVGEELLLYQERDMFDLLRYLKYFVDIMRQNNLIWGVGRGSSVSSYVLYLMGVHRIDSMFYDLDIKEFLR